MKSPLFALIIATSLPACHRDNTHEPQPAAEDTTPATEEPTEDKNQAPEMETSLTTTTDTIVDPVVGSREFSLYQVPLADSNAERPAPLVFSIEVRALKVTSITALRASSIYAMCDDTILTQTNFILSSSQGKNEIYRPSLILPADLVCNSEITIRMTILGYDVELGEVSIGTIPENSTPSAISD